MVRKKKINKEKKFIKNPVNIHPLIALISSSLVFIVGAFTHSENLWVYFIFILIIYIGFGLGKYILKYFLIFIISSIIFFLIYYLNTFSLKLALKHLMKIDLIFLSIIPSISFKTKELVTFFKQIKMPNQFILGIQIIYRFIPVLKKELKNINKARKVRTLKFNIKNIYRAYIIPFLYKLSIISDNISLSIETRGFKLEGERSIYYKIKLDIISLIYLIEIISITVYYFIVITKLSI